VIILAIVVVVVVKIDESASGERQSAQKGRAELCVVENLGGDEYSHELRKQHKSERAVNQNTRI
jgi:hypothetical protein